MRTRSSMRHPKRNSPRTRPTHGQERSKIIMSENNNGRDPYKKRESRKDDKSKDDKPRRRHHHLDDELQNNETTTSTITTSTTHRRRHQSTEDDKTPTNYKSTTKISQETFTLKVFKQQHHDRPPRELELKKYEFPDNPNIEIKVKGKETVIDPITHERIKQDKIVKHNISFYYVDKDINTEEKTCDLTQKIQHCSCVFTPNINNRVFEYDKYRMIIIDRSRKEKELTLNDILYKSEITGMKEPNFYTYFMTTSQLLLFLSRTVFIYDKAKNASYPITHDIIVNIVQFFEDNWDLIQEKNIRWACIIDLSLLSDNNNHNLIYSDELVIDYLHNIIGMNDRQIFNYCRDCFINSIHRQVQPPILIQLNNIRYNCRHLLNLYNNLDFKTYLLNNGYTEETYIELFRRSFNDISIIDKIDSLYKKYEITSKTNVSLHLININLNRNIRGYIINDKRNNALVELNNLTDDALRNLKQFISSGEINKLTNECKNIIKYYLNKFNNNENNLELFMRQFILFYKTTNNLLTDNDLFFKTWIGTLQEINKAKIPGEIHPFINSTLSEMTCSDLFKNFSFNEKIIYDEYIYSLPRLMIYDSCWDDEYCYKDYRINNFTLFKFIEYLFIQITQGHNNINDVLSISDSLQHCSEKINQVSKDILQFINKLPFNIKLCYFVKFLINVY